MSNPLIAALFSHLAWAFADLYNTLAARRTSGLAVALWGTPISMIVLLPGWWLFVEEVDLSSPVPLLLAAGLGLLLSLSWYSFLIALRHGNPAVVGAIAGTFPAVTTLVSITLLGERVLALEAAAIAIVFVGLFLCLFGPLRDARGLVELNAAVKLSLLTSLGWGLYFAFIPLSFDALGWFIPTYSYLTVSLFLWPLIALTTGQREALKLPWGIGIIAIGAILGNLATVSLQYAQSLTVSSIVAPIAGSYPGLFAVLAYYWFREPLTWSEVVGILVTIVGVVVLVSVV